MFVSVDASRKRVLTHMPPHLFILRTQEEPRPDQCVFVDHKDFYEAHATSDDNGKHTTGWPGKTSADGMKIIPG